MPLTTANTPHIWIPVPPEQRDAVYLRHILQGEHATRPEVGPRLLWQPVCPVCERPVYRTQGWMARKPGEPAPAVCPQHGLVKAKKGMCIGQHAAMVWGPDHRSALTRRFEVGELPSGVAVPEDGEEDEHAAP